MKHFFFLILYQPLYNILILLAWLIPGHSIAWAIIILTILIRIVLLPSSISAARLQVKNLAMQPKINKIRSEIKDQKEQSQALMNLYKEEGVSPFGSCLPILIQLPILIVLYQVFKGGLDSANFNNLYSFIPHPATINPMLWGLDLNKADPWILPLLAGGLQLILSLMMQPPKTKDAAAQNDAATMMNRQMVFLLPITTVLFGRAMPAALVIYWIITTIFSIGQQWYVNKEIMHKKVADGGLGVQKEDAGSVKKFAPAKSEKAPKAQPKDLLYKIMNKRLDKQEKKSGVSVTVRTKKKN